VGLRFIQRKTGVVFNAGMPTAAKSLRFIQRIRSVALSSVHHYQKTIEPTSTTRTNG
jgi:hypothetical protein